MKKARLVSGKAVFKSTVHIVTENAKKVPFNALFFGIDFGYYYDCKLIYNQNIFQIVVRPPWIRYLGCY